MNSNSLVCLIILFSISTIDSQDYWKKQNSKKNFEVEEVLISNSNKFYISIKHKNKVFESVDSGQSWHQVWTKKSNFLKIDSRRIIEVNDKIVIGECWPCNQYVVINGGLTPLFASNNCEFKRTRFNNSGVPFIEEFNEIYGTDSLWNKDINNLVIKVNGLLDFKVYNSENNYAITRPFLEAREEHTIFKFNTINKNKEIYSKFIAEPIKEGVIINSSGDIFYTDYSLKEFKIFYTDSFKPNIFSEFQLSKDLNLQDIYYFGLNNLGDLFLFTNEGVYIHDEAEISTWHKCHRLSDKIPKPNSTELDLNFYFKDSLTALISYGDFCGVSKQYFFTERFNDWKEVIIGENDENIIDLKADKSGRLYGYRYCDNFPNIRYLYSDDNGINWELLKVANYEVNGLSITNAGDAIAVIYNKELFYFNSITRTWDNIETRFDSKLKLTHFYNVGEDLLLSAYNDNPLPIRNFLFRSIDNGRTWVEIKSPVSQTSKYFQDFQIFRNLKDKWFVSNSRFNLSLGDNRLISSTNKGQNWKLDSTFLDFLNVSFINQLPDGRNLISGFYNKENYLCYGLFITNLSNGFDLFSDKLSLSPFNLTLNSNLEIFGYSLINDPIPFKGNSDFSKYQEYESGLGPGDYDFRLIQSQAFGQEGKIYLSLAYDGIYTNTTDIFNKLNDETKADNELFKLNYNFSRDYLLISHSSDSEFNKNLRYNIINALGQIISSGKLYDSAGIIRINDLTQGNYFLIIHDKQKYLAKKAFFKFD